MGIFSWGKRSLVFEHEIYREGDIVTADTDWNLSVSSITGVLIRTDTKWAITQRGWFIKGQVLANTDGVERVFPVTECWNMRSGTE